MNYREAVFAEFDECRGDNFEIETTDYDLFTEWAKTQPKPANKSLEFAFKHLTPTKNFNRKVSSYKLKHLVEKLSDEMGEHEYCGNLDFIIAACQNGFKITKSNSGSCNYCFNLVFDLSAIADKFDGGNRVQKDIEIKKRLQSNHRSHLNENKSYFAAVTKRHHLSKLYKFHDYEKVVPILGQKSEDCITLDNKVNELFWFADKYPPNGGGYILKDLFIQRFGCHSGTDSLEFADFEIQFVKTKNNIAGVYLHLPKGVTSAYALQQVDYWLTFHLLMGVKTLPEEFWV